MSKRGRQVQDDAREASLARALELRRSDRRIGPDATDAEGNLYELKTMTGKSLTTGRDFGPTYIAKMRGRYLVVARGAQTEYGFTPSDMYFLHPDDLEEWIGPIEDRLADDGALVELACRTLAAVGVDPERVERLRAIGIRGMTINNPKIPWRYVVTHGTRLGENPALDLRALVAARPLATGDA